MYWKKKKGKLPQHRGQQHVHKVDDMLLDKNCLNTAELIEKITKFRGENKKLLHMTNTS